MSNNKYLQPTENGKQEVRKAYYNIIKKLLFYEKLKNIYVNKKDIKVFIAN